MKRECEVVEATNFGSPHWVNLKLTYPEQVQGTTITRTIETTMSSQEWPADAPHPWPPVKGDKLTLAII